jgi:hypothetical protein
MMNPLKIDKIRDMTPSKSIKDLHRIMGLFSYYRRYIKNLAQIALPLNKQLRKNEPWVWLEPQINAFNTLKDHRIQCPILRPPDFHKLFTDASNHALGFVLSQIDNYAEYAEFVIRNVCFSFTERCWNTLWYNRRTS